MCLLLRGSIIHCHVHVSLILSAGIHLEILDGGGIRDIAIRRDKFGTNLMYM